MKVTLSEALEFDQDFKQSAVDKNLGLFEVHLEEGFFRVPMLLEFSPISANIDLFAAMTIASATREGRNHSVVRSTMEFQKVVPITFNEIDTQLAETILVLF